MQSKGMIAATAIGAALVVAISAQAGAANAPAAEVRRVSADIRTLASDAFGGRAPGTEGETRSVAFIIARMKAAGLQPGGPLRNGQRSWTQSVPLRRVEFVGSPSLAIGGKVLRQGDDLVVRAPLSGNTSLAIKDAPLVFLGYGVDAPERRWDDFKGVDLRGKIMVVLVNDPDFEATPSEDAYDQFGGRAMTYYGRWTYKFQEAARRGALGCLIIHEDMPASYGWSVIKSSDGGALFDIVRKDAKAAHPIIEGWLQRATAVDLFKASGLDFEQMKAAARRRDFRPVVLKPSFDVRYQATSRTIVSHNVLGLLPGKARRHDTVIYSAHWDHLGIGEPDATGDRIYNGAVDNASGVAMMLELARGFATRPRPERSILFLALTAEEQGLLGSEYYAANPVYPLATTVADINVDGALGGGEARDFSLPGNPQLDLVDLFSVESARFGRHYTPGSHPEAGGFYRGDSFSFALRGVPSTSFFPGRDLVNGGLARGNAWFDTYNRERYHQPSDEWRADLDWGNVLPDLALLHAVGEKLANGGQWPQWLPGSEFKALRDSSSAARR